MSVCDSTCRGCRFHATSVSNVGGAGSCDYILINGHRRGCPAGNRCVRYQYRNGVARRIEMEQINMLRSNRKRADRERDKARRIIEKIRYYDELSDDHLMEIIWRQRSRKRMRENAKKA